MEVGIASFIGNLEMDGIFYCICAAMLILLFLMVLLIHSGNKALHNKMETMEHTIWDLKESLAAISESRKADFETWDGFSSQLQNSLDKIGESVNNVHKKIDEISQETEARKDGNESGNLWAALGEAVAAAADNTAMLADNVKKLADYSHSAGSGLKELSELGEKTDLFFREVKKQTDAANVFAEELKEVTDWIMGIADQADLLALNANIEAARAGEEGSGFSVVAAGLEALAEESGESAAKITNKVHAFMGDSSQGVQAMDEVMELGGAQNAKLVDTLRLFDGLGQEILAANQEIAKIDAQMKKISDLKKEMITE